MDGDADTTDEGDNIAIDDNSETGEAHGHGEAGEQTGETHGHGEAEEPTNIDDDVCAALGGKACRANSDCAFDGPSKVCSAKAIAETTTTTSTAPETTTTPAPTPATTTTRFTCTVNDADADGCECPNKCLACRSKPSALASDPPVCTECFDGFVKAAGACVTKVSCKASKILTPPRFSGEACRCNDRNCNYCDKTSEGEVCKVCRNGLYLNGGQCVAECPAGLTSMGSGEFRRRCVEPFECAGGNLVEFDGATRSESYGCKCATKDNSVEPSCTNCDFRAGEFGQMCTRCKSKKLLHNGQCKSSCVGTGLAAYRPGNAGGECRDPFVCALGKSETDGSDCRCPKASRRDCNKCKIDTGKSVCIECDPASARNVLVDGVCLKRCPAKTHETRCLGGGVCGCFVKLP